MSLVVGGDLILAVLWSLGFGRALVRLGFGTRFGPWLPGLASLFLFWLSGRATLRS